MKHYFYLKALSWVNKIREKNGLDSVSQLEKGLYGRSRNDVPQENDCSLARTITQSEIWLREAICFGKVYKVPRSVSYFLKLYDKGKYPELITNIPSERPGIDYLDFIAPASLPHESAEKVIA